MSKRQPITYSLTVSGGQLDYKPGSRPVDFKCPNGHSSEVWSLEQGFFKNFTLDTTDDGRLVAVCTACRRENISYEKSQFPIPLGEVAGLLDGIDEFVKTARKFLDGRAWCEVCDGYSNGVGKYTCSECGRWTCSACYVEKRRQCNACVAVAHPTTPTGVTA